MTPVSFLPARPATTRGDVTREDGVAPGDGDTGPTSTSSRLTRAPILAVVAATPLDQLVAPDWARALAPVEPQIRAAGQFLRDEVAAGRGYLPAGDDVLRAFRRPLAQVRVLVVGQDPYPTPGHPMGLSFSVQPDVRPLPRSLGNIFRELVADVGVPLPASGDLSLWAD